jgi:Mitochondrial carrier protein
MPNSCSVRLFSQKLSVLTSCAGWVAVFLTLMGSRPHKFLGSYFCCWSSKTNCISLCSPWDSLLAMISSCRPALDLHVLCIVILLRTPASEVLRCVAAGKIGVRSPHYFGGPCKAVSFVYSQHGLKGLYKGFLTLVLRDGPTYGTYMVVYECLYRQLTSARLLYIRRVVSTAACTTKSELIVIRIIHIAYLISQLFCWNFNDAFRILFFSL